MPTPACSQCKRVIPETDINVAQDVAYCRACNLANKLSDLVHGNELTATINLQNPPAGAWYQTEAGEISIGATHRSWGSALGMLAISLFWNGIVSVFVLLALSATLHNLHVNVPDWFPAPKMNGGGIGVGMNIFLWLFLTPFIVIGTGMILGFFSSLIGRTEITISSSECLVFVGIGSLGWKRRFNPRSVTEVRINDTTWRDSDGDRQNKVRVLITTSDGKAIEFGSLLTTERRNFIAGALRKVLGL